MCMLMRASTKIRYVGAKTSKVSLSSDDLAGNDQDTIGFRYAVINADSAYGR